MTFRFATIEDCARILDFIRQLAAYVVEGVWQKIEVERMNVVLVNGEKAQ